MEKRKVTKFIVIHCAATRPSMDIGNGRDLNIMGAHAAGYNHKSIGVCMVGGMADDLSAEDNFTDHQWTALKDLIKQLKVDYPDADIIGHNEISKKECPSFDVQKWKEDNL